MTATIARREFIAALGGAAAWPLAARAQQSKMPVVGYLSSGAAGAGTNFVSGFLKGLSETGFIEGRNVMIEYRFAEISPDRLTESAAELVSRHVDVIAASGIGTALAAKAATSSIPIVFRVGVDAVGAGLVASLNRPGGNVTGVNDFGGGLGPKRLQLLHDLLPSAARFAALGGLGADSAALLEMMRTAAATIGVSIEVVIANSPHDIDMAFSAFAQQRIEALVVSQGRSLTDRRAQLVTLAAFHHLPAIYADRLFTEAGGLASYGSDFVNQEREAGTYVGRILKGEKPSDLPVARPTRTQFVINLQTAKLLGIKVPPQVLAITDEVIE
jgi:putative ABC transport system substrate-binding protein